MFIIVLNYRGWCEYGLHYCPFCRVALCQWLGQFDDGYECHCYDSDYDNNDTSDNNSNDNSHD